MLLVDRNDLLHLVIAAHEDARSIVDMLGHHRQHPFHPAIDRLPASWSRMSADGRGGSKWAPLATPRPDGERSLTILEDHRHGRTLVQDPQFAFRTFLVRRIGKDASVQQRPISVGHHRANISSAVRFAACLLGVLEAVEVFFDGLLPVEAVAFVDAVDRARSWHLHVRVREDELAQGIVHREAVDRAALHRDDELSAGTIHGESASNQLGPCHEEFFLFAFAVFR